MIRKKSIIIDSQAGTFRPSILPVTHLKVLKGIPFPFLPSGKKPLGFSFVAGLMLSQKDMNV